MLMSTGSYNAYTCICVGKPALLKISNQTTASFDLLLATQGTKSVYFWESNIINVNINCVLNTYYLQIVINSILRSLKGNINRLYCMRYLFYCSVELRHFLERPSLQAHRCENI